MSGEYTDNLLLSCHGDGVSLCKIDCQDTGGFYTCIGVDLDCYTTGQCVYHCDNSNACCGCTVDSTLYQNNLNCYEGDGNNNCIQVCCVLMVYF